MSWNNRKWELWRNCMWLTEASSPLGRADWFDHKTCGHVVVFLNMSHTTNWTHKRSTWFAIMEGWKGHFSCVLLHPAFVYCSMHSAWCVVQRRSPFVRYGYVNTLSELRILHSKRCIMHSVRPLMQFWCCTMYSGTSLRRARWCTSMTTREKIVMCRWKYT